VAVKIYGIPNCDTIKKARVWLEKQGVNHVFHDYKKSGITEEKLTEWAMEVGTEALLNKSGTTFRALPQIVKDNVNDDSAIRLMIEHPSMIKRPVLEYPGGVIVGFKSSEYEAALR
jgi:arsenate reductase